MKKTQNLQFQQGIDRKQKSVFKCVSFIVTSIDFPACETIEIPDKKNMLFKWGKDRQRLRAELVLLDLLFQQAHQRAGGRPQGLQLQECGEVVIRSISNGIQTRDSEQICAC